MTRRHPVFRRLLYLLLTTMLSASLGTTRAAAADSGYPPPPGAYRSESQIPRPAQLPTEQSVAHSVDTATQASRGSAGLLPLPADTFSASDTADILFGSVPTLPPSTADSNDPAHSAAKGGVSSSPGVARTTAPDAPPAVGDGFSMDFSHDEQPPSFPDQGIPSGQHSPSHAPTYPGHQRPAPSYYQGYPDRPESHPAGYPQSGGHESPYRMSDPYLMPPKPDYAPDAAQYAPSDAMAGYPARTESKDLPGGPPASKLETTGTDIFRPAE